MSLASICPCAAASNGRCQIIWNSPHVQAAKKAGWAALARMPLGPTCAESRNEGLLWVNPGVGLSLACGVTGSFWVSGEVQGEVRNQRAKPSLTRPIRFIRCPSCCTPLADGGSRSQLPGSMRASNSISHSLYTLPTLLKRQRMLRGLPLFNGWLTVRSQGCRWIENKSSCRRGRNRYRFEQDHRVSGLHTISSTPLQPGARNNGSPALWYPQSEKGSSARSPIRMTRCFQTQIIDGMESDRGIDGKDWVWKKSQWPNRVLEPSSQMFVRNARLHTIDLSWTPRVPALSCSLPSPSSTISDQSNSHGSKSIWYPRLFPWWRRTRGREFPLVIAGLRSARKNSPRL